MLIGPKTKQSNLDISDEKFSNSSLDPPRSVIHVVEEVVTIANEPTPPKPVHEDPVNLNSK